MQSGFCRADHLTFRLFDGRGGLLGEAVPLDAPPPTISLLHTPFSSLFLFNLLASFFSFSRSSRKHRRVRFRPHPLFPPMTKARYRPRRRVFLGRLIASARLHTKYLSRPPSPVPPSGHVPYELCESSYERIQPFLFNQPWSPPDPPSSHDPGRFPSSGLPSPYKPSHNSSTLLQLSTSYASDWLQTQGHSLTRTLAHPIPLLSPPPPLLILPKKKRKERKTAQVPGPAQRFPTSFLYPTS